MIPLVLPIQGEDHVRGNPEAPLVVVKYADFQCPDCRTHYGEFRKRREELLARARFVFRHFPRVDAHPKALRAAEGAEAAGAQGRFWEMHDLLFEEQGRRPPGWIYTYAERLGLDMTRFERDLTSRAHSRKIWSDLRSGRRSGVSATPTVFVGDEKHDPSEDFGEMLDGILERASAPGA